jgi:hypothetical protein
MTNLTQDETLNAFCDFMLTENLELMTTLLEQSMVDNNERCFRGCAKEVGEDTELYVNGITIGTAEECRSPLCPEKENDASLFHTHPETEEGIINTFSATDWLKSIHEQIPVSCLGFPEKGKPNISCHKINPLLHQSLPSARKAYKDDRYDLESDMDRYARKNSYTNFGVLIGHLAKLEKDFHGVKKNRYPEGLLKNGETYLTIIDELATDETLSTPCEECQKTPNSEVVLANWEKHRSEKER